MQTKSKRRVHLSMITCKKGKVTPKRKSRIFKGGVKLQTLNPDAENFIDSFAGKSANDYNTITNTLRINRDVEVIKEIPIGLVTETMSRIVAEKDPKNLLIKHIPYKFLQRSQVIYYLEKDDRFINLSEDDKPYDLCFSIVKFYPTYMEHVPSNMKTREWYNRLMNIDQYKYIEQIPFEYLNISQAKQLMRNIDLDEIPENERVVKMCEYAVFEDPSQIFDVPENIQTQYMWCLVAFYHYRYDITMEIPARFYNQHFFDFVRGVHLRDIPVMYRSSRLCYSLVYTLSLDNLEFFPEEVFTYQMICDIMKDTPRCNITHFIPSNILDRFGKRLCRNFPEGNYKGDHRFGKNKMQVGEKKFRTVVHYIVDSQPRWDESLPSCDISGRKDKYQTFMDPYLMTHHYQVDDMKPISLNILRVYEDDDD